MIDTHTHLYMAEYDVDGQVKGPSKASAPLSTGLLPPEWI